MKILVKKIFLLVFYWTHFLSGGKIYVRPGRHVCTEVRRITKQVPSRQTFCKPEYRPRIRKCPDYAPCPQYDVMYKTAVKTVYNLQHSAEFYHACCPGWKQRKPRDKGCMEPICSMGCGENGKCLQPDKCVCPRGYTGPNCDTDIDECASRDNNCHQMCKNTAGSYMCACQEGFILAIDGKTCTFCFTCQPEFTSMQQNIKELQTRVLALEKEKENLIQNMTYLDFKYEEASLRLEELHNVTYASTTERTSVATTTTTPTPTTTTTTTTTIPTTTTSTTTQPTTTTTTILSTTRTTESPFLGPYSPYDRLISLSEQIGLLEERLELCTCRDRQP